MLNRSKGVHNERLICKHSPRFAPPRSGLLEPRVGLESPSQSNFSNRLNPATAVNATVTGLLLPLRTRESGEHQRGPNTASDRHRINVGPDYLDRVPLTNGNQTWRHRATIAPNTHSDREDGCHRKTNTAAHDYVATSFPKEW